MSFYVAIRDPFIQTFVARSVATYLSNELGTEISIGGFYVNIDLSTTIKDMQIYDLENQPLFKAGAIKVTVNSLNLKEKLQINAIELSEIDLRIVKYKNIRGLNLDFLVNYFSTTNSDTTKSNPFEIKLRNLEINGGAFQYWYQDDDVDTSGSIDYDHIVVTDIKLKASNISIINDSISGKINSLSAIEKCGFNLKNLSGDVVVCNKGLIADNLRIETPDTQLNLQLKLRYDNYSCYLDFIDSVNIEASIYPSKLYLADIGYFAAVMFDMTNKVSFAGKLVGNVRDFTADEFSFSYGKETTFVGRITMNGLPDFFTTDIDLKINRLTTSIEDIGSFAIPTSERYVPVPANFLSNDIFDITGIFKGNYDDFSARTSILTATGRVQSDLVMRTNPISRIRSYKGQLITKNLNLGKLTNNLNTFGKLNMDMKVDGKGFDLETAYANLVGRVNSIDFMQNTFTDIDLAGDLSSKMFNGSFSIKDSKLVLDFRGLADLSSDKAVFDFESRIKFADLYQLNLSGWDTIMDLSTHFKAKFTGLNADEFLGSISFDTTKFVNSSGYYSMNELKINMIEDLYLNRKLNINSDFFDFELGGLFNFDGFVESFKSYVNNFVAFETMHETSSQPSEQDFYFNLKVKNSDPLSRLFAPSVQIAKKTSFSGVYTSKRHLLNATLSSEWINVSGVMFQGPYLLVRSDSERANVSLELNDVIFHESTNNDSTTFGIEKPSFTFDFKNDSINFNFNWDNNKLAPQNRGDIRGYYHLNETKTADLGIQHADIIINDSVLSLKKANRINFNKDFISIENFQFFMGNSSLSFEGHLPFTENDSLSMVFQDWNVSTFDVLTRAFGFDLDGKINGELVLANLVNQPAFSSNLHVADLQLNGDRLGEARIVTNWSNLEESMYLNAQIINKGNVTTSRMLNLRGFYYPSLKTENIRFDLSLENFRLKILNQFLKGIVSRVEGLASGEFMINGTVNKPDIVGKLKLNRTAFKVDYLNVNYSFQHEFEVLPDKVLIDNLIMYDTLGNKALVNGVMSYNYFRDLAFNINIFPESLLALNTNSKQNELFYGSAIMSGEIFIKGPLNNIEMGIKAISQKGTNMVIPLNTTGSIGYNDYITFIDKSKKSVDQSFVEFRRPRNSSDFDIKLETTVTPDAGLKIFLPYDVGILEAKGSGVILMNANALGDFTLNGDYIVQTGQFLFSFENLPKRRFDLQEGGRISWTGDPYEADIDVKGLYKLKASLSWLGLDSTSSLRNRENVDCIIHLTNSLFNPDVKFSIRLPDVDTQIEQAFYTVLDTTNDAMMTQQMISLLVLGSFSYSSGGKFSIENSSFDMLSGQISGLLSQISKDFDIGVRYRPGDQLTSEELEVALSTQLFNDRVSIDGNFGMIYNQTTTQNASNIVGDVDIRVKLTPDGRFQLKAFNHSNNNAWLTSGDFDNYAPYTQGIGVSYRQEFDQFGEIFRRKKQKKLSQKQNEN